MDLGCGTGHRVAEFAAAGFSVSGVDMSADMLARADTWCTALPGTVAKRLKFQQSDARTVRTEELYDAVVCLSYVASYQTTNGKFGARIVFQFDDWPFSRRWWHPKPLVDFLVWRHFLPAPSVCLAVNDYLSLRENERSGCPVVLCPGAVSEDLRVVCRRRSPFEGLEGRRTVIGYFGGLWPEKGAGLMLEIMQRSNGRFIFHICGAGPLAPDFEKLNAADETVRFHGRVDETPLFNLVSDRDALINVYSSIEKMGDGISPFKVVEYVASGRLVTSTELPAMSMREIQDAVHFVTPDAKSILDALSGAESLYRSKRREIEKAMAIDSGSPI